MKVSTSISEHQVATISVEGEVNAHSARLLQEALRDLVGQGHRRLLIDARQMDYIASAGLRVLLAVHRELVASGGEMRVYGLKSQVREIYEQAGFEKLIRASDSRDAAMEGW